MKTTVLFGLFLFASAQELLSVPEKAGLKHDCQPTDACIANGGYCIESKTKEDCNGLFFPKECKSALCSCCVENKCDSNPCGPNSFCKSTTGSYDCVCYSGYNKVNGSCVDIDECNSNPCDPNSVCSNSPGSFSCNCNAGYVFCEGACVDDNECTRNPCPANSNCRNTNGSYECNCATGFSNQTGACVDVNECNSNSPPCSAAVEMCINTDGSYSCVCRKCSPQCEQDGVFLLGYLCARLITEQTKMMTYDEGNMRCGYPNILIQVGSQPAVTVIGSMVMLGAVQTAWVGFAPDHPPHTNGLCPVIVKNGTSFEAQSVPCDNKYIHAICETRRLW